MDKDTIKEFTDMMRNLLSDVQGAPYPGPGFEAELYEIWYEHVQRNAQNCFEFLDAHFPSDKAEFDKSLSKMFK